MFLAVVALLHAVLTTPCQVGGGGMLHLDTVTTHQWHCLQGLHLLTQG